MNNTFIAETEAELLRALLATLSIFIQDDIINLISKERKEEAKNLLLKIGYEGPKNEQKNT